MVNQPEQPQSHDAVLGQRKHLLDGSAVLGGLARVKQWLASDITERRIVALSDALNYGEEGLGLVIEALYDQKAIARAAYAALQQQVKTVQQLSLPALPSSVGMSYLSLRKLLSVGHWVLADHLTMMIMVEVARRVRERYDSGEWQEPSDRPCVSPIRGMKVGNVPSVLLERYMIIDLPCIDLQTLDQLWLDHSQGKFGFSVQARIWEQVGAELGKFSDETYRAFGDRLGWRKHRKGYQSDWCPNRDISFDLSAPKGHLPWHWEHQGRTGSTSTLGENGKKEKEVFYSQITCMAFRLKECGRLPN